MKYKLIVHPAIDVSDKSITFLFETVEQLKTASETTANLLMFMQDEMKIMIDYANVFEELELVDGEWLELEEFEDF